MATDIKLDDNNADWVTIEAAVIAAKASDLILEAASRRSTKGGRFRRALVHGEGDSLIVNFNSDYPGGAQINDAVINKLNIKCEQQRGDVKLPKSAKVGDVRLIQSVTKESVPGTPFSDSILGNAQLWLCVGHSELGKEAIWSQVPLSDPVVGTL